MRKRARRLTSVRFGLFWKGVDLSACNVWFVLLWLDCCADGWDQYHYRRSFSRRGGTTSLRPKSHVTLENKDGQQVYAEYWLQWMDAEKKGWRGNQAFLYCMAILFPLTPN